MSNYFDHLLILSHYLLPHAVIGSEPRQILFLAPLLCGFLFVYEISWEPLNGFAPNSHGRHVWSLTWTSLKVKVTRGKNGIFRPFRHLHAVYVW